MSGPEDNPADDHQPTKEEWEKAMNADQPSDFGMEPDYPLADPCHRCGAVIGYGGYGRAGGVLGTYVHCALCGALLVLSPDNEGLTEDEARQCDEAAAKALAFARLPGWPRWLAARRERRRTAPARRAMRKAIDRMADKIGRKDRTRGLGSRHHAHWIGMDMTAPPSPQPARQAGEACRFCGMPRSSPYIGCDECDHPALAPIAAAHVNTSPDILQEAGGVKENLHQEEGRGGAGDVVERVARAMHDAYWNDNGGPIPEDSQWETLARAAIAAADLDRLTSHNAHLVGRAIVDSGYYAYRGDPPRLLREPWEQGEIYCWAVAKSADEYTAAINKRLRAAMRIAK